jgi:hypothetical protein
MAVTVAAAAAVVVGRMAVPMKVPGTVGVVHRGLGMLGAAHQQQRRTQQREQQQNSHRQLAIRETGRLI